MSRAWEGCSFPCHGPGAVRAVAGAIFSVSYCLQEDAAEVKGKRRKLARKRSFRPAFRGAQPVKVGFVLRKSRIPLFPIVLARERLTGGIRQRQPERMVMDESHSVAAYDQGAAVVLPVHQSNALALSSLLPEGGVLLDLGCGSARLLARLALGRPDARFVGLDLSKPMLDAGRQLLQKLGLADRVELRSGDMTTLDGELPDQLDLISCDWALHHLPDEAVVGRCLQAIRKAREATGCGVYIFDFARLRNQRSWPAMMSLALAPGAGLLQDGVASERAAFSFGELTELLQVAGFDELQHARAGPLGEYQVHWVAGRRTGRPGSWQDVTVPSGTRLVTHIMRRSFPSALMREV
jgi:arsenite methyltransferase